MKINPQLKICVIGNGKGPHVRNRTKVFADMGHNVTLITDYASEIPNINEILLTVPQYPIINPIASTIAHLWHIRKIKADIYFVHFPRRHSAWAAAIANVRPLVVTVMGGDVNFDTRLGPTSNFQRSLTVSVLDKADKILAKSNDLIDTTLKYGNYENKIERVIWGVDLNFWYKRNETEARLRHNISEEDFVLLSPKILTPFYNIHLIIEAMRKVVDKHPNAKLLVTERWPQPKYKEQLTRLIEKLGIEKNILFIGELKQEQLPEYYSISDIVITLPSSDGLPQAMFEAMACEVPYMLGNLPHYTEVVTHQDSAYFVDFNPDSIADGIIHLIEDGQLRKNIIRNGLDVVRSVADIQKEAKRVEEIFYTLRDEKTIKRNMSLDYMMIFKFFALGFKRFIAKVVETFNPKKSQPTP